MRAEYVAKVLSTPWALNQVRARTILAQLSHSILRNERPAESIFGEPLPKMQIIGDVALIPISGILSMDVPPFLKTIGINLTDVNDIAEEIDAALRHSDVRILFFDVASPGGWDLASFKLFELIEAAKRKKLIGSYVGDARDMASGAYYGMVPGHAIYSGYYADGVGCVGCYLAMLDDTEFWAQWGLKWEIFRDGELKGLGEDSLTEKQRAYLQSLVDFSGGRFRKNVQKYRKLIDPAELDGRWFEGQEAAKHNFVDGNADNLQAAISKFRKQFA